MATGPQKGTKEAPEVSRSSSTPPRPCPQTDGLVDRWMATSTRKKEAGKGPWEF